MSFVLRKIKNETRENINAKYKKRQKVKLGLYNGRKEKWKGTPPQKKKTINNCY